jgi:peroxiredoxin
MTFTTPGVRILVLSVWVPIFVATASTETPAKVHDSAESIAPLQVGAAVPEAKVTTLEGENVGLRALVAEKPSVLVFYRGGWCPYCTTHLKELKDTMKGLEDLGYQMVAISSDTPEAIAETLEKEPLPYTLVSDADLEAATAFGIVFQLDDATIEKYKGYDIDLCHSKWRLPVPAVFISDASGILRFVHAEADYTKRLASADLLKAARAAQKPEHASK